MKHHGVFIRCQYPAVNNPWSLKHCLLCSAVDQPLVTPALLRNIAGQAVFQLGVMYTLVSRGDAIFGVPSHSSLAGAPSEHYTIVFNAFVLLQLFNQASALEPLLIAHRCRFTVRMLAALPHAACCPDVLTMLSLRMFSPSATICNKPCTEVLTPNESTITKTSSIMCRYVICKTDQHCHHAR